MKKTILGSSTAILAVMASAGLSFAQQNPSAGSSPAAVVGGLADGPSGGFSGYVPSASTGMAVGGSGAAAPAATAGEGLPKITDGKHLSAEKVEGFNEAVEENFPMTPDMIRRYREIFDESQRALLEREEPDARVDAGFISLEPGETPPTLTVAPGIASVIGFYDVTGQPWPITQYVLGSGSDFQVIQLGEESNNVAVTPLARLGWTNLVIVLKGEPKPVVMRVGISEKTAHFRHDVQIMSAGPNASANTAAEDLAVREAGSATLLAVLSGVDLPAGSKPVQVQGVDARGWIIGENLYLRSKHPLLSPSWLSSMSGPDGIRVYEVSKSSVALFSVDGTIVRADVVLP
ncbi:DotH/IcmK family type IV secretion protein [Defluviimonas salinarum]|uniref:DotH/IcmK family type IV secretion protein n=1 Tax=Defluviimonas salinarum TaxID=2992147 RepID=A0ABT3J4M0_9RHOB|nr:DotH/IcmK family type IV secretion protein [Defluviimonas salinarum]MCW3782613.1 DotH/IcmK family type IV secretion protein [Defluviimonas salinarum]